MIAIKPERLLEPAIERWLVGRMSLTLSVRHSSNGFQTFSTSSSCVLVLHVLVVSYVKAPREWYWRRVVSVTLLTFELLP
jgi:endonuclease/exonuclease/phosphatase (EEP) superfamily protein YafD